MSWRAWENELLEALGFSIHDIALASNLDAETPEEEPLGIVAQEFEYGRSDLSAAGDAFRWLYEREVPLWLLDAEADIDEAVAELETLRQKYRRYQKFMRYGKPDEDDARKFKAWVAKAIAKRERLEARIHDVDSRFTVVPDATVHQSPGAAMYTYLEMYIDQMSLGTLAVAFDCLEEARGTKELSWYYYVQCGLAVCHRLAAGAPGANWGAVLSKLKEMKAVHHAPVMAVDERTFGESSFDMAAACDTMAEARTLAELNDVPVADMYYQLADEREADALGLPKENYREDFRQDEVDLLIDCWEAMVVENL